MIDHVHLLVSSDSIDSISAFVRHYTSLFVLESNHDVGRKGPLFYKSFGSAPKKGSKRIRSAIVYLGNNPVEKKLCDKAECYQWNFLAYLDDKAPFSEQVTNNKMSLSLRKAISEVRSTVMRNKYLTYTQLRRMLGSVSRSDRDRLVDYIISRYYPFNRDVLLSFYEGVNEMFLAMNSTTGSEYDIKETYYSTSDTAYREMTEVIKNDLQIVPVKRITVLPVEQKILIARMLKNKTSASTKQILKFLHLVEKERNALSDSGLEA